MEIGAQNSLQDAKLSSVKQKLLSSILSGSLSTHKNTIPKRSNEEFAELSFVQQRLWLLEQLVPNPSVYNMHDAVRIRGSVDVVMLEKVLTTIVARHEILRTAFISVDGNPVQKILPPRLFNLPVEDLSNSDVIEREKRAYNIAIEETKRPFILEHGYLFRARLIQIDKNDQLLLWTMHHIVSDGWSLGIIIKEVMTLCDAFSLGQLNPLPNLRLQYADFSSWQQHNIDHTRLNLQLDFWLKELKNPLAVLSLPTDRKRPTISTYAGDRCVAIYSDELTKKLRQLALKQDVTLFMLLLAAFDVLLYRYSGMQNILVGVPVANRNITELHDLVGFFANTVVMCANVSGDQTFKELLSSVKRNALSVYENQDIPFELLVDKLQPERSVNYSPIFQVMFVLQNEPMPSIQRKDIQITPVAIHNGTSKFDLLLNIIETPEGLNVGFEYSTDLFDKDTILRMLEHYRILLENISLDYEIQIDAIPIMDEVERNTVLSLWNQTQCKYELDCPLLLHKLFEDQVKKTPNAIAVKFNQQYWSYSELNDEVNKFGHYLQSTGISKGSVVAIHLERCYELVLSVLAVLKVGGIYLPLDVEYPESRLLYMLQQSLATCLIYKSTVVPNWIGAVKINSICLTEDASIYAGFSQDNVISDVAPEDLAYVIYTSGTTGNPKGATNTHIGVCNRLLWMQHQFNFSACDVILQKTPFGFDVAVWELLVPLISGSKLVLVPPGEHRDSTALANIIQQEGVTVTHFVPSMLRIFLQDETSNKCASLRLVICSGETLSYELKKHFKDKFTCNLYNLYGPTETAIDVTYWNCDEQLILPIVPIGRPIANTQIYILDKIMQPTPIGIPGEIYIGGIGVGDGYINDITLTKKKFVDDPFSSRNQAKLYKTGDCARFLQSGIIEFLGRSDYQVKIRGLRVELQEIETILDADPNVDVSAVTVHEDQSNMLQKLIAYVVPSYDINVSDLDATKNISVAQWQDIFNRIYNPLSLPDKSFYNFSGWNSSYTNKMIPDIEMHEWLDVTLKRILDRKPRKVLEIGCGTGLLLLQLAQTCDTYVGSDISVVALDYIRDMLSKSVINDNVVTLFEREALDFSELERFGKFDMIILNSVVQYFPSVNYLLEVLQKAYSVLAPKGSIFLGDIRNFALNDVFFTATQLAKIPKNMNIATLRDKIGKAKSADYELSIAPEFFNYLAFTHQQIQDVQVMLRRGRFSTEMCCYRYDVFLTLQDSALLHTNTQALPNNDIGDHVNYVSWESLESSFSNLNTTLSATKTPLIIVTGIPNKRLVGDVRTTSTLQKFPSECSVTQLIEHVDMLPVVVAVDPEELWKMYENEYHVNLTWAHSGNIAAFDAWFIAKSSAKSLPSYCTVMSTPNNCLDVNKFVSHPECMRAEWMFINNLKNRLKHSLPYYMIPDTICLLQEMPLSSNGKIDRNYLKSLKQINVNTKKDNNFVAPQTKLEKCLLKICGDLLNDDNLSVTADFFASGGNSLLASQLVLRLREETGIVVPLRGLFQFPNMRDFALYIEGGKGADTEYLKSLWTQMQIDSFLDADITAQNKPVAKNVPGDGIFLTGSTGFLGIFLLRDLLISTSANIACLVRAESITFALQKLKDTASQYKLLHEIDFNRIQIVLGDLELPLFGLSNKIYNELVRTINVVYHCGAKVDFMSSYRQLYAANVSGTKEIFRFASTYMIKPVHFISSIYILVDSDRQADDFLSENDPPRNGHELRMGYLQTKWVSEQLAEGARNRGIPVNIYRPGRISGDTVNGACQLNDFFWGLIRTCLHLKAIPDTGLDENLVPVDYVSQSIVNLSLQTSKLNYNYHLINTEVLSVSNIIAGLIDYGYVMESLPYEVWSQIALNQLNQNEDNLGTKLAGFLSENSDTVEPIFSNYDTQRQLEEIKLHRYPLITPELLCRYIDYFVQQGFFPKTNQCYDAVV